ncbi:G-type lectin S-receptor-like serine/threonine-protein kinase RLK1 [Ziziphus jujuba]|uniref:Receptor-like serine/threonine-protein kinase n=1 Tax=Ziziphus jujuba TaxID=326968 RepID=A0A6P4AJZ2_ZIZJJ|nr:G-type lectin S-receptor-like serine/threonine-protein kinase RLK1 [Ziziphus jujuba]
MANFALPYLLSFLLLLHPLFNIVAAQTNGNISVTSSLTAGDNSAWLSSPSEDFAFGFHRLGDNSFLPAIWYHKLRPETTTVWYANGSSPAPRNSKLELTADLGLVLKDPQGSVLWKSGKTAADPVAYAVMNDTGNFVLIGGNSKPIWESFHHPTDTLLPSQIMELGGFLSSRTSDDNFSPRRFQFLFEEGSAKLITKNLPGNFTYGTYYTTETGDNVSNPGYRVLFDSLGLYVLRRNGSRFFITDPEDTDSIPSNYYKRVSLNSDGVLTLSSRSNDPSAANETWRTISSIPDNICNKIQGKDQTASGACGFNSICSIQSDGRPKCECPEGYSLHDPTDAYSGCRPNFLQGCDSNLGQSHQVDYFMIEIKYANWPNSDYEVLSSSSMESCKNACLHDCLCTAAILGGDGRTCWKKKPPLTNGRAELSATAYLKIANNSSPNPNPPTQVPEKDQNILVIVVLSVLLGSSVLVIFVGAACMGFFWFFNRKLLAVEISPNATSVESRLRQFTYKEMTEATNGFKEELGRGSCGIVYKGETRSTGLIAVKMLDRVFEDNDKEFKAEVNIIGQTHHKNLVRLVGYCDEKQHRLLVLEFLRNGTLARFLFGDLKPSWKQRTQIAFGIARGLVYLHEECSTQIIHCDIKPQNILLDEYYNARISDFGLAKLLLINQSYTKTNIRGTKGYVAPEWFRSAPVSVKVDVYSFGVLLLEIICCRRNVDMEVDEEENRILTDWVYDCYVEGKLDVLVENDKEAMDDIEMVERFVMVAIWCIQENPNVRPTMKQVMLMLEGILQISLPPSPSPFSSIC